MAIVSIVFGGLLIGVSLWGWSVTEARSPTLWIPGGFGAALVVLGLVALKESLLKHAMHAAAALGLIGMLVAGGRLIVVLIKKGWAGDVPHISVGLMTLLCALFVALCVSSFVQARRRRRAAQKPVG